MYLLSLKDIISKQMIGCGTLEGNFHLLKGGVNVSVSQSFNLLVRGLLINHFSSEGSIMREMK